MAVNWDQLNQPGAFERAFDSGFQLAEYGRQRREQTDQRNALSAYATDPSAGNFNALIPHLTPQATMEAIGNRGEVASERSLQDTRRLAAGGDPAAMARLAGVDFDAWRGLSSDQRAAHAAQADVVSNVAQYVSTLPENERSAAWDQQIGQIAQRYPGAAEYRGQYSPELLQSTINEAGDFKSFYEMTRPDTFNIAAGGSVFQRDANGVVSPVVVPNYGGAAPGAPAGQQGMGGGVPSGSPLSQPAPQQNVVSYDDFRNALVTRGANVARQELAQSGAAVAVQSPDEARTLPSGTRIILPDGSEGRVP